MSSIQPVVQRSPLVVADRSSKVSKSIEPGFELPDFDIKNIDLNSIQSGILRISAPLNKGHYVLPGKYQKAKVVVPPDCMTWLSVCVGRNPKNEAVITKTSIQISPPIKVTNPSSAYEPPGGMNKFRDLFADVIIDGIEICPEGQVLFQGQIKKGFSSEDIKTAFKPEMFPILDLRLETLKNKKVDTQKAGISEILAVFSSLVGEAKCSAKIHADTPSALSVPVHGVKVKTSKRDAELRLHARAKITPEGEIELKTDDRLESAADFLGLETHLEGEFRVSQLAKMSPELEGQASANMSVRETQVWVDYEDWSEVPVSIGQEGNFVHAGARFIAGQPVKISGEGLVDVHLAGVEPIRVGALQTRFQNAHLRVEGSGQIQGSQKSAQGKLLAAISEPRLAWRGLNGSIDGKALVEVEAKDLNRGTIQYRLESSRLPPFVRKMGFEFLPDSKLALSPQNSGLSEFLDPVNQFVWDLKGIVDPTTAPVGKLGSAEWRKHIEAITGAPIRKHNQASLLIDGKASYPERIKLIQNAKRSICLQSLIFKDDDCGMETAKALVEAYQRGIQVRVIVDSLGNLDSVKELIRGNKVYDFLRENGVSLELYSNLAVRGFRNLLAIVEESRSLQGMISLKDLVDPKQTLSTLHMLAKVAYGTLNLGLNESEQKNVCDSLKMILGNDERAKALIDRLANITPEKPLRDTEILDLMTQVLNLNHRWHEKYLVVDGEKAILGGMNIADEYLKGGMAEKVHVAGVGRLAWRDTDILVEGEGARDAYQCFARNWKSINGEELSLEAEPAVKPEQVTELQVIQSRPQYGISHPITNLKIEALKSLSAGDKAYEATAYFMPSGALKPYIEALKMAAGRGVDVRILTNSRLSTDMPQVNRASVVSHYRDLLNAGVRIFERIGTRTMHQKTAVYGSQLGLVGSYNLDNRSASLNSESLVVVHEAKFAVEVENMIVEDMAPTVAKELRLDDVAGSEPFNELQSSAWAMLGDLM